MSDITVADLVLRDFAAQCVIRGLFLGCCVVFLFEAIFMYLRKRTWIALLNIVQLLAFMGFLLVLIVFLCLPASELVCGIRTYLAVVFVNSQVILVWVINWIKLSTLFERNPWVKWGTAALCIASMAGQFQMAFNYPLKEVDALLRCRQKSDQIAEIFHIATDVLVRVVLSGFFVAAILQHTSKLAGNSHVRLKRLVGSDIRATFVDTIALIIKLIITLLQLPTGQTRFVYHTVDFLKAAGTHWFVLDVASGGAVSSVLTSKLGTSGNHGGNDYTQGQSTNGGVMSRPMTMSERNAGKSTTKAIAGAEDV